MKHMLWIVAGVGLAACGGKGKGTTVEPESSGESGDPHAEFAPLDVGADWQSYRKVNARPVLSQDHGKRFVDTYVNELGHEAYTDPDEEKPFPEGTVIVKVSWEAEGDAPSDRQGPIFVMEKRAAGYAPQHRDWYYAIHWQDVPEAWQSRVGGAQIYWRSPSSKVDYCWKCHEGYDREVGLVPEEARAW